MAKTIFIVDDSPTMRMSVKATLEMSGFLVESAGDGVQALSKLKTGIKPDLIITDINMPNMGGLELIKNVRALPAFRFTPILTLTTESLAAKRDEGKKLPVPAAALDCDKGLWRTLRRGAKGDGYLFSHKALAKVFRGKLLAALREEGFPLFRAQAFAETKLCGPATPYRARSKTRAHTATAWQT